LQKKSSKAADYTTITTNTIESNLKGILIFEETAQYNTITTNTLTNKTDYGIRLVGAMHSTISGNTVTLSRVGVDLATSSEILLCCKVQETMLNEKHETRNPLLPSRPPSV
jgi:parallel beta-helix repeat protein